MSVPHKLRSPRKRPIDRREDDLNDLFRLLVDLPWPRVESQPTRSVAEQTRIVKSQMTRARRRAAAAAESVRLSRRRVHRVARKPRRRTTR